MSVRNRRFGGEIRGAGLSRRELVATLAGLSPPRRRRPRRRRRPSTAVAQGRTINHVSLAVTDVEKSAAFYKALLGLKEVSRPGNGGINLGLGDGFLGLYKLPNPGHGQPLLHRRRRLRSGQDGRAAEAAGDSGDGGPQPGEPDQRRRSAVLHRSRQDAGAAGTERLSGLTEFESESEWHA